MTLETVRLDKLCSIQSGGTPRRSNAEYYGGGIPWAKIQDLESPDGIVRETDETLSISGLQAIRKRIFPKGTLLLAMYGSVGKVAVAGEEMSTNQAILGIQIEDGAKLASGYLVWWLRRIRPELVRSARGVTQKNISATIVRNLRIPLPPLPEQRRIAAILDKADAVRRKRQQTLDLADQFLRSAFLDMFGDPVTNPKRWPIKKLSEAFVTDIAPTKCGPFGSALRKDEYADSGVPVLTMDNIAGDAFSLEGCLYITEEKHQTLSAYAVREGDIIISRAGTVGKMCVVPSLDGPAIISTNLIRLSLDSRILEPAFFVALMAYCRGRVGKLRTGNDGSYSFMNTGILRRLPVAFPSPTVQADWVRLLSWMNQHISDLSEHKTALHDLSATLVQRAFQGSLQR